MKKVNVIATLLFAFGLSGCSQISEIAKRFIENNQTSKSAPFLYMATYSYDGNYTDCLNGAEKVLRANGFTENIDRRNKDGWGNTSADSPNGLIAAEIECDMNLKTTAVAISSNNNDSAYDAFDKIGKSHW